MCLNIDKKKDSAEMNTILYKSNLFYKISDKFIFQKHFYFKSIIV